ncbi:MAG: amylo-alpha-1,6-glucosidase [Phototrophicaceae bacterium]
MMTFDRETCARREFAATREWLVTNGIGGYACGTVGGVLARHYHGLLVAALEPPLGRTLLLSKLNETVTYAGKTFALYADHWADGTVAPVGYQHLDGFALEGTIPVWRYRLGDDALLEKRVWMEPGSNTTYVQYTLIEAAASFELSLDALVNYRDHHDSTVAYDWEMNLLPLADGLRVIARAGAVPFTVRADRAEFMPDHTWSTGYFKAIEAYRGEYTGDDHLLVGSFRAALRPGGSLTVVATTEPDLVIDGQAAYARRQQVEASLIAASPLGGKRPEIDQLILAADQFIVRRATPDDPDGRTVIAGYPWFSDWGRDTMIALPGLTLATGQHAVAARILRTFARFVDRGMIPNRFPDVGETPEYNTVDATLWFVEAVRAYFDATRDDLLLRELFPVLRDIIEQHINGTRYSIRMDPADGLLYAGEKGVQLTWMDVKIDDWVVTPRTGKAVEINALWYNALACMVTFARLLGESDATYADIMEQVRASFQRFWIEGRGYCYDVIDGPQGDDPTLRPNQVIALALADNLLTPEQGRSILQNCAGVLLTPRGLRSLDPAHPDYQPTYGGDRATRDAAYHQGTVWAWLIGPFVTAHLRVYGDAARAQTYVEPLLENLREHGIGSLSEIFDAEPPHTARGCFAQAWSVAEALRALQLVSR